MFYTMYLSSVCQRRQWPEPYYEPYREGRKSGIYCSVRVNNRVYRTDVGYETETLAFEGAALKAYMICRNFSANDGMFPGQRPGSGPAVQGLPVAIGTGRSAAGSSSGGSSVKRNSDASYDSSLSSADSGLSSGGNSPRSSNDVSSCFEQQMRSMTRPVPRPARPSHREKLRDEYTCDCGRAKVQRYGCCKWCLQERGWTR